MLFKSDIKHIIKSGLFDTEYYLQSYPDIKAARIDPLKHFVKHGWKERRNPSSIFDINFYLSTYPDVAASGINPLIHYIKYGLKEGRKANSTDAATLKVAKVTTLNKLITLGKYTKKNPHLIKRFIKEIKQYGFLTTLRRSIAYSDKISSDIIKPASKSSTNLDIPFASNGILFITHDATATGAPILLYQLCRAFHKIHGEQFVTLILNGKGEILDDFRQQGSTLIFQPHLSDDFFEMLFERGYRKCIANTVLSGQLSSALKHHKIETVYLIHELPNLIQNGGYEEYAYAIAESNSPIVFGSHFVADKFISNYPVDPEKSHIISQGIQEELIYRGDKESAKKQFATRFGIPYDSNLKIVLGAGYAHHRKGTDLFCKTAELCHMHFSETPVLFIWVGDRDPYFESWYANVLPTLPYRHKLLFIDFQKDVNYIFAAADVFVLSSREDPYPGVALSAFANHVPVIMFEGTGGIAELITEQNGRVIPPFDCFMMVKGIMELLEIQTQWDVPIGSYSGYLNTILELFTSESAVLPPVSVVIPNYNYAHFLKERLGSILAQSVPVDEIIFLDDCSSDHSLAIAKEILKGCNIPYTIIANQENAGIYHQWKRGITTARNNLVWIAEADDVAEKKFLERLLPYFLVRGVCMAYTQSSLIDADSKTFGNAASHTDAISTEKWSRNYVENGKTEIREALVYRNTIPNVSACIIDKSFLDDAAMDTLLSYRYCGDWFLYVSLMLKGQIGFCKEILNNFRKHGSNVTTAQQCTDSYLLEVLNIKKYIYHHFPTSNALHNKTMEIFQNDFLSQRIECSTEVVEKMNTLEKLLKKEILFVTFNKGFGGSEVFWFEAAQYFANINFSVSVLLNLDLLTDQQRRKLTSKGIHLNDVQPHSMDDIELLKPDLVIFSIGDHNDGGEWFEYCYQQKIKYIIINQLVKEKMWTTDPGMLHKIFHGYQNAQITFFTCHNNIKIFERKMKALLTDAMIHFNPISINRDDYVSYPPVDDGYHLAFPARLLTIHKGQDVLLQVIASSKWKRREVTVNFYGEGPDQETLYKLVAKLKLENVVFHGYVADVRSIWQHNHAFILTSHMEGIPIVLLGAMFAGRAAIVTDVGGNTEIVTDNETGFVAHTPTTASVDEALERAWQRRTEWEAIGKAARASVLGYYPKCPLDDFYNKIQKALA